MKNMTKINSFKSFLGVIVILIVLNIAGSFLYKRFDLTQDKRYTLSEVTLKVLDNIHEEIVIDVFLEGNFPYEFRRLQTETRQLLEEYQTRNNNIKFQFINPLANDGSEGENMQLLLDYGLKPISISVNDKGKQSQEVVFPWAIASAGERSSKIQLLKNMMGANTEEKVISSVQHLEFAITESINKVISEKTKKIAILKGNGELDDIYIADFLKSIRENYHIAPYSLEFVGEKSTETLAELLKFDLAIVAKPTTPFTDKQLLVLDQFVMKGGKMMWLMDQVQADFDSLQKTGSMPVFAKDQSLGELFFKYGVRINPVLVKDEVATPIKLAVGRQGSETQYQDFLWKFAPFVYPDSKHAIVNNVDGIRFDFTSPIDTLKSTVKKTILLKSSPYSSLFGTPSELSLDVLNEVVNENELKLHAGFNLAVLMEGKFESVFKNRVLPFKVDSFSTESVPNKMIVISDGDIIRNQLDQNYEPLELGYDKWTNKLYGNKEFIMNSVQYLLDDSGLISLRTKEVYFPLLDKQKVFESYRFIQIITIVIPIVLLVLFGCVFTYLRKRKFAKKVD